MVSRESIVQQDWEQDISETLRDFKDTIQDVKEDHGDLARALRKDEAVTGGERNIGETHQGREILELLQNCRDAINRDDDVETGEIYITVTNEGILVANTGERFDFTKQEVRDAAQITGHSAKSGEAIGEYGIGLTSIRAVGEAYEVWTRLQDETAADARVRFSPSHPTGLVYAQTHDTDLDRLATLRSTARIDDEFRQAFNPESQEASPSLDLNDTARQRVAKLPLFFYPLSLTIPTSDALDQADQDNLRQQRAAQLLQGEVKAFPDSNEQYVTAALVDYIDSDWETFLEQLGADNVVDRPTDKTTPEEHAKRIWEYLAYDPTNESGLSPETLIHLGDIETIYLERVKNGETVARQRWELTPSENQSPISDDKIAHEKITATIEASDKTESLEQIASKTYDWFTWDESPDLANYVPESETDALAVPRSDEDDNEDEEETPQAKVAVLFPEDGGTNGRSYPPHLYYPISSIDTELPFCLHGNFQVESSRQNLHRDYLIHNAAVLRGTIDLLERVVTHTVGDAEGFVTEYPWATLPPVKAGAATDLKETAHGDATSVTRNAPVNQFCRAWYKQLRGVPCIQTDTDDTITPNEGILHWDPTIVKGISALKPLKDNIEEPNHSDSDQVVTAGTNQQLRLLAQPEYEALLGWIRPTAKHSEHSSPWANRVEELLVATDTTDHPNGTLDPETLIDGWGQTLQAYLDINTSKVVYQRELADDLFLGTCSLLTWYRDQSDQDQNLSDILTAEEGDGAPLFDANGALFLPCSVKNETDQLRLVSLERRPEGATYNKSRVVRWRDDQQADVELPPPPVESPFTVFVLDEEIITDKTKPLLRAAGKPWGISAADGKPDYYRAFLDAISSQDYTSDQLGADEITFVASVLDELETRAADDLKATVGGYHHENIVEKHTLGEENRRQFRHRLGVRRAKIDHSLTSNNHQTSSKENDSINCLRDLYLPSGWQALRDAQVAASNDSDDEREPSTWESLPAGEDDEVSGRPWNSIKNPRAEVWQTSTTAPPGRIAEQLAILGISILPGVRVLALYDEDHPDIRGRQTPSWNPHDWKTTTDTIEELQETLESLEKATLVEDPQTNQGAYLDWITAPETHPGVTAGHSDQCDVLEYDGRQTDHTNALSSWDVNLSSWVWLEDPTTITMCGGSWLLTLLEDHGSDFAESIFVTGWSCTDNHNRKDWEATVPTVLNWQLRHIPIWDETRCFEAPEESGWDDDGARLAWAVVDDDSQASRLFPTVDLSETTVSREVWDCLGVKPLSKLTATEAAYRLQKLQSVYAAEDLTSTDQAILDSQALKEGQGWKAAYTQLLRPLVEYLNDDETTLTDLPYLTHFPVRGESDWMTIPINQLTGRCKYYTERSQRPWEDRRGQDDGPWLLEWPTDGALAPLANALDAEDKPPVKPAIDRENIAEPDDTIKQLRQKLAKRKAPILAVVFRERQDLTDLETEREKLDRAIRHLRPVSEEALEALEADYGSEWESAIWQLNDEAETLEEETYGLAYAPARIDGSDADSLEFLATGLCLLFDQNQSLYFKSALRNERSDLRSETRLDEIETALRSTDITQLEQEFTRVNDLLKQIGIDELFPSEIKDDDLPSEIANLRETIGVLLKGAEPDAELNAPGIKTARALRSELPADICEVLATYLSARTETTTLRKQALQLDEEYFEPVVKWLQHHEQTQTLQLRLDRARNIDTLARVWYNHAPDQRGEVLSAIDGWDQAVTDYRQGIQWWKPPFPSHLDGFTLTPNSKLEQAWFRWDSVEIDELAEKLLEHIGNEETRNELEYYIEHSEFPKRAATNETPTTEVARETIIDITTTAEYRPEQFVQAQLPTDDNGELIQPEIKGRGQGGGGSSGSSTGRPEFAEQYTLASVLQKLTEWTEQYQGNPVQRVINQLMSLKRSQNEGVMWHVPSTWDEVTNNTFHLNTQAITQWNTQANTDGTQLLFQAFDATNERGPGYDILDITGAVAQGNKAPPQELTPQPIEVKAVQGEGPHTFRFTVNEFRRAHGFVANNIPYTILLVPVPAVDSIEMARPEELSLTHPVRRITISSPRNLYQWLAAVENNSSLLTESSQEEETESLRENNEIEYASTLIIEAVKGGYLSVSI